MALPEGEGRDRGGGVVADPGQRQQVRVRRSGTSPPCLLDDRDGRRVQPQRPARVAEPAPGPHRLAGAGRDEVGRLGQAAIQASQTGSTRATGVCWSMISETSTPQGVASGRRHGRSRAWRRTSRARARAGSDGGERHVHRRRHQRRPRRPIAGRGRCGSRGRAAAALITVGRVAAVTRLSTDPCRGASTGSAGCWSSASPARSSSASPGCSTTRPATRAASRRPPSPRSPAVDRDRATARAKRRKAGAQDAGDEEGQGRQDELARADGPVRRRRRAGDPDASRTPTPAARSRSCSS